MSPIPPSSDDQRTAGPPRSRLPDPRSVLAWLYVGRVALSLAILMAALWIWRDVAPGSTRGASLIFIAASAFSAASFWYSHGLRGRLDERFLYAQAIFDTILITWIVHITGGADSTFSPLYILVISAAAIFLPFLGGILIGLLASVLYFAEVMVDAQASLSATTLLQIALFATVALVTGYIGDRLRQTGTALGEVETELHQLRLDTGDVMGSISTGIITVDGYGRLAYINPAAAELLALPPESWLGRSVLGELDRVAPGLGAVIARTADSGTPIRRFETSEVGDGHFVLGVSTTLMERRDDGPPPVTAIFQDITEKMRVEALRRRAERLEAVAELSASLAHEIKNPLASIRSAVEQLDSAGMEAADRAVLQRLVIRESDRLSRLLSEFIDFARVKMTAPEPVELSGLVRNVVELVRTHPDAEGRTIRVSASEEESLVVRGAEDLIHRAIFNLVLNGVQWAGDGGWVEVALDRASTDILSPALGISDTVRVVVADSGPGIPEEIAEHVFDPFFTQRSGGTGLGLALVQRAVEAHGGAIFVDEGRSPGGAGGVFTMYLPVYHDPGAHPDSRAPQSEETIPA